MLIRKKSRSPLIRMIILAKNYRYLIMLFLISILGTIRDLSASILLIQTTNELLLGNNVIRSIITMIIVMVIGIPLKAFDNRISYQYRAKAQEAGMEAIFSKITNRLSEAEEKKVGEIISICTADFEIFLDWMTTGPGSLLREISFLIGALLYSYTQNVTLTNIVFPIAILTFPIILLLTDPIREITENRRKMIGAATNEIQELLSNPEFIKSYNLEEEIEKRVNKNLDICYIGEKKEGLYQGILEAIRIMGSYLPGIFAATIGAIFLVRGEISAGFILGFVQMTVQRFKTAIPDAIRIFDLTNQASAVCKRIDNLLFAASPTTQTVLAIDESLPIQKEILYNIKNISFSYNGSEFVLQDINFNIRRGEKLAIIGSSGSGKSTLLKLLLGTLTPAQGEIYYLGINMKEISPHLIARYISPVFQSSFLFNATIRENISGQTSGNDDKIWQALKNACLDDFITEFPKNIDETIKEVGGNLSGGQRQRFSIARAFYKNAPIFVLDEPFSALDSKTARQLKFNLAAFTTGKTTITITHKFSDIIDYDHIIVLKNGYIVQYGTHKELVNKQGEYQRLYWEQLQE